MRIFFHHLYHSAAGLYDLVASLVSLGRWHDWVRAAVPFVRGPAVLELGHGPGHLLRLLHQEGLRPVGLDESMQMLRLAGARLHQRNEGGVRLARGRAEALPFPGGSFDTVVATFPSDYMFDPRTLADVRRVLHPAGRLVVIPAAWIIGRGIRDRAAAWLFRVTGEAPRNLLQILSQRFTQPLEQAGFAVESRQIEIRSSIVLVVIAARQG